MNLPKYDSDDCQIEIVIPGKAMILTYKGGLHPSEQETLTQFFEDVVKISIDHSLEVSSYLRMLRSINSSTIVSLMYFMRKLSDQKVKSEFIYDSTRKVQRATFRALEFAARNSPHIKVIGKTD